MVPASFALRLAELVAFTRQYGPYEDVTVNFVASSYIHAGQEQALEEAIGVGATHVLWLETDMGFPKDTAIRLTEHNRPVVATNAVMRHYPIRFTAIKQGHRLATEDESFGLEEVDECGLAVMLMRTDVVNNLTKPWFRHEYDHQTGREIGHDAIFCRRLREAGHRIYIDHDLSKEIEHIGLHAFRPPCRLTVAV